MNRTVLIPAWCRTLHVLLLTLLVTLSAAEPARAQEPPPPPSAATPLLYAPVRLGNRTLFEVTGTGAETAAARADRISRRLQNLVSREAAVRPFGPTDVHRQNGQTVVTLGGEPVMVISRTDAEDNLLSADELALLWGQKMAGAVSEARQLQENPLSGAGILIRNSVRDLFVSTVRWLPRLGVALILSLFFWGLAKLMVWLVCAIGGRAHLDPNFRQLMRALAYYGTWAVGMVAIFSALGFQTGGVIATLGITGFVLGFAFKDILSHFLAGMMLLLGRQFRIGDQIVVNEHEGTVEVIELRATHLRTYDNRLVIIPNGEVFTSVITSNTASPHRRREFAIGISYEEDIQRAVQVALETVRATPGVLAEPAPDVLVDELTASAVILRVRFTMNSLRADYLKVGSACMQRVKEAFQRENIRLPSGVHTVVLGNPAETAEQLRLALAPGSAPAADVPRSASGRQQAA